MRRILIVLVTAVVGVGLLTALPGAAAASRRHASTARPSSSTGRATTSTRTSRCRPFRHQRVITTRADDPKGLDINAQICFFPGSTTARAGSSPARTPASRTRRRAGGSSSSRARRSASSGPRKVGKLMPTYQGSSDNAENYGCGFLRDGRVLTTDVGNQATGNGDGQLIVWFPPFDRTTVRYCKIDVGIATAGGICGRRPGPRLRRLGPAARPSGVHRYTRAVPDVGHAERRLRLARRHRRADDHEGARTRSSSRRPRPLATPNAIVPAPRGGWYVSSVFNGVIAEYSGHGHVPAHDPPAAGRRDPRREAVLHRHAARHRRGPARRPLLRRHRHRRSAPDGIGPGDNTGTVRRIRFVDGQPAAARHHGQRTSRSPTASASSSADRACPPVRATPERPAPVESRPLWGDMRTCTASARPRPAWRVPGAEIGAAWGRKGGRGTVAVCAPDEDPLTLAVAAAIDALDAAGLDGRRRRRALVGLHPPAVRRGSEPRGARRRALAEPAGRRCAHERIAARRHGGAARRGRRRGRRARSAPRSWSSPTASAPGSAPRSRPAPAPAPPRWSSPPTTGPAALDRPRHPLAAAARPLPRRRRDSTPATSTTPRLFREEMFLPAVLEVAEHLAALDPRAWSLPDPDGRLGTIGRQAGRRRPRCRRPTSTPRSATPRPRRRSSARSARSTRPAPSRSSAPAAAAPPAWSSPSTRRCRAPTTAAHRARRRGPARVVRGAPACARPAHAERRDDPDGRAARERAVRARRRRDGAAARWPLRRLRHDQHPAVDPPHVHRVRRLQARAGRRSPGTASVHTFVVNQTMPAPFVAPLPIAVRRPRRRRARDAPGRRRRHRPRDRLRGRPRAAALRARAGRAGLRLQVEAA